MATILDLFKSRKTELYGGTGPELFIDSKGVVNIPRQSALTLTSPDPRSIPGFIGNQLGGLLKGSAERPTDTIFGSNKQFSRTVSLAPGAITGVKYAADGIITDKNFYVKKNPGEPADSIIAGIQQGVTTPGSFIQEQAAKAIKSGGINGAIKSIIRGQTKFKMGITYNPGLMEDHKTGKVSSPIPITFKGNAPIYAFDNESELKGYKQIGVVERQGNTIHTIIENVLKGDAGYKNFEDFEKDNKGTDMVYVRFDTYSKAKSILLPAVINGISEDMTPEWSNFKYLGSPFNLYRYGGVERSIKFSLKLYYVDHDSKLSMISKLNSLREFVFPDKDIAAITYAQSQTSQLAIKPNLVYLTISGLYNKVLGVMDSLSFSIDDSASWPSTIPDLKDNPRIILGNSDENKRPLLDAAGNKINYANPYDKPYPSVIDVSVSMKIIETPKIETVGSGSVYSYNFTGN